MNNYIKNYILNIINTCSSLMFPIITFPYISRVLRPEKLGIINFVQSYGYYFISLATFGLTTYAVRELSIFRDDKIKSRIFSCEIFTLNFSFSFFSTILYFIIALFVDKLRINIQLISIYSIVIFTNFMLLDWFLQSYDDYLFSTIRSFIIRFLSLVAVFIFVKQESDYIIYMIITTVSEMGARVLNMFYINDKYTTLRFLFDFIAFKKHILNSFTIFIFKIVNSVSSYLDKLMIGMMLLFSDVGKYSAGVKFPIMLCPIVETIGIVLFPKINISANRDMKEYYKNLNFNYNSILLLSIPMTIGFILLSPKVIYLFAGKEYYESILVARIMSLSIILVPINDLLCSKVLIVFKKDSCMLITSIIVAFANIVLNLIFIPKYGIYGAAIATFLSYIISVTIRYIFVLKCIDFKIFQISIIKYISFTLPFVVMYLCFKNYINSSVVIMLVFIFISISIYIFEILISNDEIGRKLVYGIFKKN